jgi:monoterpene epsilon-lactone hydrolase
MASSPEFQTYLASMLLEDFAPLATVHAERDRFAQSTARVQPHPGIVTVPVRDPSFRGEWLLPTSYDEHPPTTGGRVVLYLHGGGYTVGSSATCRPGASYLAGLGNVPVLSIDYALTPESPFPAGLADVIAAYRGLLLKGHRPETIALAGESAGAALAVALLVHLRDVDPLPACAYLMSPGVDLSSSALLAPQLLPRDPWITETLVDNVRAEYPGHPSDALNPLVSALNADLRGLPPLLVQAGEREWMRDSILRFAGRARRDGVDVTLEEWPDMFHCWAILPGEFPEADQALANAASFINKFLGDGTP